MSERDLPEQPSAEEIEEAEPVSKATGATVDECLKVEKDVSRSLDKLVKNLRTPDPRSISSSMNVASAHLNSQGRGYRK